MLMLAEDPTFTQQLLIVTVPATIAAVASVAAVWATRANKRRLQSIQETSETGVAVAQDAIKKVDTGNGKDLGVTVHDMAQTVELQAALAHTNTRELLQVVHQVEQSNDRLDRQAKSLDDHLEESRAVHDELRGFLTEIRGQMHSHDPDTGVAK